MSTNRRRFLIGAGVTGFGLTGAGKLLTDSFNGANASQSAGKAFRNESPLSEAAIPKSKLLQRFAVIADTGVGKDVKISNYETKQYAVADAMTLYHQKNPFNSVLMVGDNIYNNGEMSKIEEAFKLPYGKLLSQGVKFYAALGNHDVRTDNGNAQVKYDDFNMNGKHYYTHAQGDVRFFVLETSSLVDSKSSDRAKQLAWLDRELAASRARVNIVYGHHNIYSVGGYIDNDIMIRDVNPLLKKHKVKLWINGHDHNYQRWNFDKISYLVCGGGGAKRYELKNENIIKTHPHLKELKFAQSINSFGVIEVYQDKILLIGVDYTGKIIDRGLVALT